MQPQIKKEWIAALRSGDYKQGTGFLHTYDIFFKIDNEFCCLGVLCELAVQHGIISKGRNTASGKVLYGSNDTVLPIRVREWANLNSRTPSVPSESNINEVALAELNDNNSSFDELADLIEEYL